MHESMPLRFNFADIRNRETISNIFQDVKEQTLACHPQHARRKRFYFRLL